MVKTKVNMPKRKLKVSVDRIPNNGMYRAQLVETLYTAGGKIISSNFLGKRTFRLRKEAEAFAKEVRKRYKR